MLYNLDWLKPGKPFPPVCEADRILRYRQNKILFRGEHFDTESGLDIYEYAINRILATSVAQDCGVCYPILLNYQKLISLKKADLVCGEEPEITGIDASYNDKLTTLRQEIGFDTKLYATVVDLSRYGDAIWRKYKNEQGKGDFTVWEPQGWFPIVRPDGTNRISHHVLTWKYNEGTTESPKWRLSVQIHPIEGGYYLKRTYNMNEVGGIIGSMIGTEEKVLTGFDTCAVVNLASITTSGTVYGYDDYMPIDSLLSEIMTRLAQISSILDVHASPAMTGPVTLLTSDPKTGEKYLQKNKFYAVSPGEEQPKYLTWDGQLNAAFTELELLLKQLYVITEMGDSILGAADSTGQAISGTAMRSKMAAPLITVRRLTNILTYPVKQLLHDVTTIGREEIPADQISIEWNDGLPTDPREDAELAKLLTGVDQLMPVEEAITEFLHKSVKEAQAWREGILKDMQDFSAIQYPDSNREGSNNPNANAEGDPEGNTRNPKVNPNKKGSQQGLNEFHGLNNK